MSNTKKWMVGIAAILILIVVLQNTETVQTEVLFVTVSLPRALLLLVTMIVGGAIGYVYGRGRKKIANAK